MNKENLRKYRIPLSFAVLFAGIGSLLIIQSFAATDSVASEAESGSITGNAAIVDGAGASGQAVRFGSGGLSSAPGLLANLPQRTSATPKFLANGLIPPTNRWFSGLAFKQPSAPNPVFAYPLALQTTANGFTLSKPNVVATAKTVFGSFTPDLEADLGGVSSVVSAYDDLSVSIQAGNAASYRLTQGSPILYMNLNQGRTLKLTSVNAPTYTANGTYFTINLNNGKAFVVGGTGITIASSGGTLTVTADANARVGIGALPDNPNVAAFVAELGNPLTSTKVSYSANDSAAQTTFNVTGQNGGGLMALLPAQQSGTAPGTLLGTYKTILGTQKLYKLSQYSFNTASPAPKQQYDLSKISGAQRTNLINALNADVASLSSTGFTAPDSYFGGKQLARAANLLSIAKQLGQENQATQIATQLKQQLGLWLDPAGANARAEKNFYYDNNMKGMVGQKVSFGSADEFNDHHFHYGYIIYAAGVLARYDNGFASANKPMIDLLIRDIASPYRDDQHFPYMRSFDQYAGHSWASGTSPFGDGNNQESSSEAVNAWYGMYLWATATGDNNTKTLSQWLYGREADSALQYYLNFDRSRPELAGFNSPVVSLLWGGKMDFATWFSDSAHAAIGIEILPVTPGSEYLGRDKARVATNLQALSGTPMFLDILAAYRSFSDPNGAVAAAENMSTIDDGNSKTNLLAWAYSQAAK